MEEEETVATEEESVATEEERLLITTKMPKTDEEKLIPDESDELSDAQASLLLAELKSGRRFFVVPGIGEYFVTSPTVLDMQEADWEASKTLNRALKDGLLTIEEMEETLKTKGLFVDLQEKTDKMVQDITKLSLDLEEFKKKEDKKSRRKALEIAMEMAKMREKLTQSRMEKDSYLGNTAQGKANEVRTNYLMSRCIFYKDTEEKVWPTYRDFLMETKQAVLSVTMINFLTFTAGVSTDFTKEYPESQILNQNRLD